jgi:pilus assembly protein CpaE
MTHKLASSALRTTRATFVAAPTAHLVDAREPCEDEEEIVLVPTGNGAADDEFTAEQSALPPPFDDDEPPFDPPDPEDEIFQTKRQVLNLDAESEIPNPVAEAKPAALPNAPAISLHVAWERPQAATLLAAFACDPRLARVEISEAGGGIDAAAALFAKTPSPDVLLLDTTLEREEMVAKLDRLLLRLRPETRLIVMGDANDVVLLRDLARRGVVNYFLAPDPDDVVRFICEMYAERDNARVIAVVGARGGAGASTIAHNVAWSIAKRQQARTALVDLDLSFGVCAFDFERQSAQPIGVGFLAPDVVDDAFLDRAAIQHSERLRIYAAPADVAQPFDLEADAVKRMIARIRRTAAYVVLDVPHHWDAWVKEVLTSADEVLVVATPDLASLRNAKNIVETLNEHRHERSEPLLLLSMVGAHGPGISVKDFTEAVGAKPIDALAFDPALYGMAAIKGKAIAALAPRSKAALAIDALAWVLTGQTPAPRAKAKKLLERATAPVEAEAAHALEIERPEALALITPVAEAAPEPPPAPHKTHAARRTRSYALATARPAQRGRRGSIRTALMLLAVVFACALSMQSPDAVRLLGEASGVLH